MNPILLIFLDSLLIVNLEYERFVDCLIYMLNIQN